jgi:LysM repeat protein
VVSSAAAPAVAKEARQLVADRHTAAFLPEELAAILDDLAERPRESVDRESLLLLLRTFSYLEREWSGGGMPTEAAVPAMAGLARLIRALGPIEQERGEPFVEPLTNVLAQTSDFVADYMTRSTGQEQEGPRGEWLVAEIGKLTARAEELNGAGRSVEASLLAHMAKWRARSLQYAVGRSSIERPSAEVLLTGYTPPDEEPAPDGDEEQPLSAEEREAPEAASASEASAGTDNGEAASATPAGEEQVFEVRPGENPSVIAGKHGVALEDLLSWNGWSKRVVLQVGDEYVVKKKAP